MFSRPVLSGSGADFADIALPLPGPNEGGASFGAEFARTRTEVEQFIRDGAAATGGAGALSPEAAAVLLRSRGVPVAAGAAATPVPDEARQFLEEIRPFAAQAAARLGISADLVAAHAALESGWGKKPLRGPDGRFNLFGIKAGGPWQGATLTAATTEHVGGEAVATTARFRAYDTLPSLFEDYARFLRGNPRFGGALGQGDDVAAFARGLARGGYATDPAYADKLAAVVARIRATY